MPRTANHWKIEGVHPAEYATFWGSGDREGMRFYNACAQCSRTGGVIGNPDWDANDWDAFVTAVKAQRSRVFTGTRTAKERKRTGWTDTDVENLRRLAEWGEYMAGRLRSSLPWLSSTM